MFSNCSKFRPKKSHYFHENTKCFDLIISEVSLPLPGLEGHQLLVRVCTNTFNMSPGNSFSRTFFAHFRVDLRKTRYSVSRNFGYLFKIFQSLDEFFSTKCREIQPRKNKDYRSVSLIIVLFGRDADPCFRKLKSIFFSSSGSFKAFIDVSVVRMRYAIQILRENYVY